MSIDTDIRVLHINYSDLGGGAEEFAFSLNSLQTESTLLVEHKHSISDKVIEIPSSVLSRLTDLFSIVLWKFGIRSSLRNLFGRQDEFHNTHALLKSMKQYQTADIVHLHNIHGEYFDLEALGKIAREKAVIWTLHDMWVTTGGEGAVYPGMSDTLRKQSYPLRKGAWFDRRTVNLAKKKLILQQCKNIVFVTPSRTHIDTIKAVHSKIHPTCIYYGVDTDIFFPEERSINQEINVLIYNTSNHYKNSAEVILSLSSLEVTYHLHVLGEPLQDIKEGIVISNHGHIADRKAIASLFRNMDVAAISSKVESFGLLPLELAACGVRVLLNASLPVFHEHAQLYGAELFEDSKHLSLLLAQAINSSKETRAKGLSSAEKVKEKLSRSATQRRYETLYQKVIDSHRANHTPLIDPAQKESTSR